MDYMITTDEGSEYLSHHGVLGMKRGVRKKEYGVSKRQVRSQVHSARKSQRENNNFYSRSTGKNYESVTATRKKSMSSNPKIVELTKTRDANYKKAEKYYDKNPSLSEKYQAAGDSASLKIFKLALDIGKKYVDQYKEATLRDIGYPDIERGKKMLSDYKINTLPIGYKYLVN